MHSLYTGGFKPQIVRIALLLDVFTPLADGPADAHAVARACGCDVFGTRALLDYLSSLQLLDQQDNTYTLTPTAAAFLVPGEQTYAGGWVLMETGPGMWDGVLQALRSDRSSYHNAIPWAQDAWLESCRSSRPADSLRMWRAAGIEPGQRQGLRVLDMACGCAIKSLVLARADPTVHVTCLDSAEVLEVTRDLAGRLGVVPQVAFLPRDLRAMDLGEECCDAALLGQITYALTPEQNVDLFRRVYKALSPGGTLVIDAPIVSESPGEQDSFVTLLMRALSGGAAHRFADYCNWLDRAGFSQVKQIGEKWLSATKP